jgi:ferredoxin-nitrate reductase
VHQPANQFAQCAFGRRGFKKAKFVVVQEISNKPETLAYADVILPAAAWAEKEGTMTNSERRISYLEKIIDAPGEALPDSEIICRFAQKMGYKGFDFKNAAEIYAEHAKLTAKTTIDISGLSYEILKQQGTVQWPYKAKKADAGTPRLFTDKRFYTESKNALISAVPDALTVNCRIMIIRLSSPPAVSATSGTP